MRFYVGLHQPAHAIHVERCMISLNRLTVRDPAGRIARTRTGLLKVRRSPIPGHEIMLDSGAFSMVGTYGGYPDPPAVFVDAVHMLAAHTPLCSISSQDWMCEPAVRAKTGGSIADHQRWTIDRFDAIRALLDPALPLMPVLQGWRDPATYLQHLAQYAERIPPNAWVGIGSVCRWNGRVDVLRDIIEAIHQVRPDLRLHGFGLKTRALESPLIRARLASSDSLAWSAGARYAGGGQNDWRTAVAYAERIEALLRHPSAVQPMLPLWQSPPLPAPHGHAAPAPPHTIQMRLPL